MPPAAPAEDSPVVSMSSSSPNTNRILWAVIGAIAGICCAIGILVVLRLWRRQQRPESVAPSAAYYIYTSVGTGDSRSRSQNTTLVKDALLRSSEDSRRTLPKLVNPGASQSYLSLPSNLELDDASELSYSPAAPSSEMCAARSRHTSAEEPSPIVPLSSFARLVPLRRDVAK